MALIARPAIRRAGLLASSVILLSIVLLYVAFPKFAFENLEHAQTDVIRSSSSSKCSSPKVDSAQSGGTKDDWSSDYFAMNEHDRFLTFENEIVSYASQKASCDTRYVKISMWCDSNPGNGMNAFVRGIVFAFILGRFPLVFVHRKAKCEDYLTFKRPELFLDHGKKLKDIAILNSCMENPSEARIGGDFYNLACQPLSGRIEYVLELVEQMSSDISRLSEILHNKQLSDAVRERALRVFDIGVYTTVGILMKQWLDISDKVIREFHRDYRPTNEVLEMISDTKILKIGLHIRHLPFVVKDEKDHEVIDKRALKCLEISKTALDNINKFAGCLILVATDMPEQRDNLVKKVKSLYPRCSVFTLKQIGNSSSAVWGPPSYSAWEKRDPLGDRRSMLEAYLDFFLLSEYSNTLVFSTGSTFSQLIGYRSARREHVAMNFEFTSSSCKQGYLPYPCCHVRRRWDEVNFFMRNPTARCHNENIDAGRAL